MIRVRLTNSKNSKKVLSMSSEAWSRSIELAEEYGWQPLGTFRTDGDDSPEETPGGITPGPLLWESSSDEKSDDRAPDPLLWESRPEETLDELRLDPLRREIRGWDPRYTTRVDQARLVILEDALSMGDALAQAVREYEPEPVYKLQGTFLAQLLELDDRSRPSLGAITALLEFCRLGSFTLESY